MILRGASVVLVSKSVVSAPTPLLSPPHQTSSTSHTSLGNRNSWSSRIFLVFWRFFLAKRNTSKWWHWNVSALGVAASLKYPVAEKKQLLKSDRLGKARVGCGQVC